MNMLATIKPKSDQLNADDLVGITKTITVTKVEVLVGGEQPVTVYFEGDQEKPYKPGKSMRRVLVNVWGPDATAYAGRSMTLYRDEKVQFGGLTVGGIRISHMSHIDSNVTMALTATRANKKAFTVKPLRLPQQNGGGSQQGGNDRPRGRTIADFMAEITSALAACQTVDAVEAIMDRDDVKKALGGGLTTENQGKINHAFKTALDRVSDIFPGDIPNDDGAA